MDIHTGQQRLFPAVAIVSVLVLLCLFPGQHWIANLFPGISGLVRIDPSLTILDIPVRIPVTVDLILVPGLFILSYLVVILLYLSRSGMFSWREAIRRVGAVFAGVFAFLLCMASGALISYLARDYLPKSIRNGIDSLAINADIHLPYAGYEAIHLRGNVILLACFIIGTAICIQQIKRAPKTRKRARLTDEQRMTPYERMLREKRELQKQKTAEVRMITHTRSKQGTSQKTAGMKPGSPRSDGKKLPALCRNHPVLTIEPVAVNYMPME
ncbi:MAG TPA: hypothetical protein VNS58_03170 [Puia sp.]|nr:hypothetical protein [Puia sp.]